MYVRNLDADNVFETKFAATVAKLSIGLHPGLAVRLTGNVDLNRPGVVEIAYRNHGEKQDTVRYFPLAELALSHSERADLDRNIQQLKNIREVEQGQHYVPVRSEAVMPTANRPFRQQAPPPTTHRQSPPRRSHTQTRGQ